MQQSLLKTGPFVTLALMAAPTEFIPVCPECGYRVDGPPHAPTPAMRRARALIPRRLLVLVLLAIAIAMGFTSSMSSSTTGVGVPRFVEPLITYADLQAVARGESPSGPGLLERFRHTLGEDPQVRPGRRLIEVAIDRSVPQATFPDRRTRSLGWPASWVTIRTYRSYDDPLHRSGLRKSVTVFGTRPPPPSRSSPPFIDPLYVPAGPRFAWFGDILRYQPPPEATEGIPTTWDINFIGLFATVGVFVAAWCGAALVVRLLARIWPKATRLRRAVPAAVMAVVAGLIAASVMLTPEPRPTPFLYLPSPASAPAGGGSTFHAGFSRLSLDENQLRSLSGPGGDAELARSILDAIPPPPDRPETWFLAAVGEPVSTVGSGKTMLLSPRFLFAYLGRHAYVLRPGTPAGEPLVPRDPFSVRLAGPTLNLSYTAAGPPPVKYFAGFNLSSLFSLFVLLWLLFQTTRLSIALSQNRRLRRRARLRLCANCGYPTPTPGPP